jgi:uncharacterized peroxidase-related enzyme
MSKISILENKNSTGETKTILMELEKSFGFIPNLFSTIAQYPAALKPILDLYQAVTAESSISRKLQEVANLETSRINGCNYCIYHHSEMGKMAGLSSAQIDSLKTGIIDTSFNNKEKTVIEYSTAVTKDAENIPEELYNRVKSFFTNSEIVNLTLIIGLMNLFNKFSGALGIELENLNSK